MKLQCNVCVGNRLWSHIIPGKKHVKSTLALCRHPKSNNFCLMLFSCQNINGAKYELKQNVLKVLTRFINDGKATIQFKTPAHDLYIQADTIQLKSFMHVLKRALENNLSDKEPLCSSMSVTAAGPRAPTKLVILKRSDYPSRGFPRTLETLTISGIKRCSLDRGILNLTRLKVLDLSDNCIECLPQSFNQMANLTDLNLASNCLDRCSPRSWAWIGGNLCKTLQSLNLSSNNLRYLPNQIVKLYKLVDLHAERNCLTELPLCIGGLTNLQTLTVAYNKITCLPGSIRNLKLNSLNLFSNCFREGRENYVASQNPVPNVIPVCSLKEWAARRVMNTHIPYTTETIPWTLVDYLDHEVKYCECGRACFDVFVKVQESLWWTTIALSVSTSMDEGTAFSPVDAYYCSLKCYRSSRAARSRNRVRVI